MYLLLVGGLYLTPCIGNRVGHTERFVNESHLFLDEESRHDRSSVDELRGSSLQIAHGELFKAGLRFLKTLNGVTRLRARNDPEKLKCCTSILPVHARRRGGCPSADPQRPGLSSRENATVRETKLLPRQRFATRDVIRPNQFTMPRKFSFDIREKHLTFIAIR